MNSCNYTRNIYFMGRLAEKAIYILLYILITAAGLYADYPVIEPSGWTGNIPREGTIPPGKLIELSLYASGVSERGIHAYREKIEQALAPLPGYLETLPADIPEGEGILLFLHENIFSQYQEPQTRIDTLIDSGRYNCVSSAVIYMIAAVSRGLNVEGVVTPDHAFCHLPYEDNGIDVETTNPHGYNPGQKREFSNAFGQTGFTYVPPGNYRLRTSIEPLELIGLILQNRISVLQKENRIDLSVPLAVDRNALAATERTAAEMRKEFINFASIMNGRGRYLEALDFLDMVRSHWGRDADYKNIIDTLVYNAAVSLKGQAGSRKVLDEIASRVDSGDLQSDRGITYRQIVGERLMYEITEKQQPPEALAELEGLKTEGLISAEIYNQYLVILHIRQAQVLEKSIGDLEALRYLRNSPVSGSRDARLVRAMEVFTYNAAAFVHNQFVELYRAGRTAEAEQVVLSALEEIPGNSMLNNDLKIIRKQ